MTLFDGEQILVHRSVLFKNGKISRVGAASFKALHAVVIGGRDCTLLPGLIDAHVHLPDNIEDAARQALSPGVTTHESRGRN